MIRIRKMPVEEGLTKIEVWLGVLIAVVGGAWAWVKAHFRMRADIAENRRQIDETSQAVMSAADRNEDEHNKIEAKIDKQGEKIDRLVERHFQ